MAQSPEAGRLLTADGRWFSAAWLHSKAVVPFATPFGADDQVLERFRDGARAVGAASVFVFPLGDERPRVLGDVDPLGVRGEVLLAVPNRDGALLITDARYSLLAGTAEFLAAAVPWGVDRSRARFRRDARRLAEVYPELLEVATRLPPARPVLASPSEVEPGSALAEQVRLMESFAEGSIAAPDFARAWLTARRRRPRPEQLLDEPFERLLAEVFFLLEDYVIDPALRDPGDLTDEDLLHGVQAVVQRLRLLEAPDRG
ncbi:colicin immunity domain-containing protein [Amycolatopsis sp. NPDC006131]|uniref:colicin immunity domain-containing protein n=1 Tax=Amycolatopsis sp. NPDC006131 TaxID=3156731 RepID=UPI0033B5E04C